MKRKRKRRRGRKKEKTKRKMEKRLRLLERTWGTHSVRCWSADPSGLLSSIDDKKEMIEERRLDEGA